MNLSGNVSSHIIYRTCRCAAKGLDTLTIWKDNAPIIGHPLWGGPQANINFYGDLQGV